MERETKLALLWLGVHGSWLALDYALARGEANGDTFSEVVRDRIPDTPVGKAAFATCLYGGATWFYRHIVNGSRSMSRSID